MSDKPFTVVIPIALHDKLVICASLVEQSIREFVTAAIESHLTRYCDADAALAAIVEKAADVRAHSRNEREV